MSVACPCRRRVSRMPPAGVALGEPNPLPRLRVLALHYVRPRLYFWDRSPAVEGERPNELRYERCARTGANYGTPDVSRGIRCPPRIALAAPTAVVSLSSSPGQPVAAIGTKDPVLISRLPDGTRSVVTVPLRWDGNSPTLGPQGRLAVGVRHSAHPPQPAHARQRVPLQHHLAHPHPSPAARVEVDTNR